MLRGSPLGKRVENPVDIFRRQFILVSFVNKFRRGIDNLRFIIRLVLFQNDNTRSDTGAENQVWRQLDYGINEVVVD